MYICTTSLFVHLFVVLAIVNNAAMNMGMHVSFQMVVLSGYIPAVGLLDHMVILLLVF